MPKPFSIEIVQLHALSVFVVWAQVTVQCIKTANSCKFPESRAKTVGDGKFDIEPKIAVRPPKKYHLLLILQ